MKRWNNILTDKTVTIPLCIKAIHEAAKDKSYRTIVQIALNDIENHAKMLRDMILNNIFEPSKYIITTRIEHGKLRDLCKPKFWPDQCVHHVLILVIQDKIMKRIDPLSVASIPGRGQKVAQRCLKKWLVCKGKYNSNKNKKKRANTKYVVKGDIRKCFESLKPKVIMCEIQKIIKDKLYLSILGKIIYSFSSLPLGNYLSAWILNLLLKRFDDRIREQEYVTYYLRYMDDFVIFSRNKRKLATIFLILKEELAKLGLELKCTTQLFPVDKRGIDMVGYRYSRKGVIFRKKTLYDFTRAFVRTSKHRIYSVRECQSTMSRLGFLVHCNSKAVFKKYVSLLDIKKMKQIIGDYSRCEMKVPRKFKELLLVKEW